MLRRNGSPCFFVVLTQLIDLFLSSKFDKVPVDREFLTSCLQSSLSRSSWVLNG